MHVGMMQLGLFAILKELAREPALRRVSSSVHCTVTTNHYNTILLLYYY